MEMIYPRLDVRAVLHQQPASLVEEGVTDVDANHIIVRDAYLIEAGAGYP